MKNKKWWRWDSRMRMLLTLELAIVLPAAALIAFSVWNLRTIKRDKAVEAAIQRDFNQMLVIVEKRINEKMLTQIDDIREDFAHMEGSPAKRLDRILEERPYLAHAYYYDPKNGFVFRSCPDRMKWDEGFRAQAEHFRDNYGSWMPMEAKANVKKFRSMAEKDPHPYAAYDGWVQVGKHKFYTVITYFLPPDLPEDKIALGGVIFDSDYIKHDFLPSVLNKITEHQLQGQDTSQYHPKVAIMIKPKGSSTEPFVATAGWDGGTPETERGFDYVFRSMALGIKFTGTTVEAIAQNFLKTQFLILGGLSLLMAFGIWLTYRNVTREMQLAKLKSDFVSNVSHELRTPLALVRLFAETLELGRVTPDKHPEYFRIIRKESERLTALINNILDFSRIEAGRKEYDFRDTNVTELVRETVDTYRYQIEEAGFTLELNLSQDVPPLKIDREAMARSLLNLINNAVKYSRDDKYLGVNLYRNNGEVRLEVIDHGIGIPRHEQSKVFEKFYRVGDPLVHNTKGSGLGLSLVRHIVQAHGGEISVQSAEGRGSKFIIALPLQAPMAPIQTASGD